MEGERAFGVSLVLTHACNLACSYCYMGEHHATAMSADVARRALAAAFAMGPRVHVSFFGGEPLLEWQLLCDGAALARSLAKERGAQVSLQVTTNGTLLDRARAERLRDLCVDVAVSLDGEAAASGGRSNAAGGPSFARALAGIEALGAADVPFQIIAVVTPANVRDLARSVRFLDSLRPLRILLNPAWEAAWSDADLAAWRGELSALAELWRARYGAGDPLPLPLFESKLAAAARGGKSVDCSVGRWSVAVAPSGNLYPCDRLVADDRDARWVIGHLDDGFERRAATPRGPRDPACEPCVERFRCGASCACANIAETGSSELPGGVQCWYEQTVAELADAAGWSLLEAGHAAFAQAAYSLDPTASRSSIAIRRRLPLAP